MSGGAGRRSWVPVLLIVTLGYVVWSETNVAVAASVEAAASPSPSSASASKALCEKLPGWCEKQAYSTSDRPRNKIQDKMAETRWRKRKEGGEMGGYYSPIAKSGRVKPKIEDKQWLRGGVVSRPSRHSEDWKSRLKSELFSEEDEDAWEVDDEEDYLKVEDENEEEEEVEESEEESETGEDETESAEESEEEDEEEDESEEEFEEEELESEEEFEEGDEDESEMAGLFKKRWGFDEDQEDDDSEEIIRKAKQEEDKKKMEDEAKRKKATLEQIKRDAELKKKALEEERRRKINEDRKKKVEEERKKNKEEEERKKANEENKKREEEEKRKELEEKRRKEEEENRRRINEERRKRLEQEKERKEEEDRRKRDQEERKKKEERERQKRETEEREREEAEERRKDAERQREKVEEEEKRRKEEERIRLEKEEAKKKLEAEKRKKEQEEAKKKREEERSKKEEARKESERIKKEEEKRKRELEDKKRKEEEQRREEEKRRREEENERKDKEKKKEEERKKMVEERKKKEEERKKMEEERKEKEEERKKMEEERKEKEEERKKKEDAEERKRTDKEKKEKEEEKRKEVPIKKEKEVSEQKEKKKEKTKKDKTATLEEEGDELELPSKSKTKSKRKNEKISTSEWSPDFPEFFAPTANDEVQNEECKKQSRIYVQHLRRMRTWALQMYDATAKLPSGILSGNVNQLGDFDECLAVDVNLRARGSDATPDTSTAPLQPVEETSVGGLAGFLQRVLSWGAALVKVARGVSGSEVVNIRGRYCLASVDVDVIPDPRRSKADNVALHDAVQRALSYRFLRGSINDTQHFVPRFSTVSWALCVPAACSARDVQDGLLASIRNWEHGDDSWGSGKVRFQLSIPDDACRLAPEQPAHKRLPPSFYFVIGGLALLVMLALVATLKDQGEADEDMAPERRMLIAFSLRRSWAVLSAPDDIGSADIHCMHGLRAICSLALYMAHKVIPAASAPYSNRGKLTQAALSPLSLLLRSSVVYTDTFLLLSGALSSFHFSRELARTGRLAWRDRYVARLFRLTPPLIAVLLYYSFVMEHIGDGPRWGPLVEANAKLCRKNMWRNLLYIQNFYPFKEMCAPQTHQLALDVQLSLLSAPLVWLLNYSPLLASPILLVLQAASAWLRHRTALQHRVALLIYHGQKYYRHGGKNRNLWSRSRIYTSALYPSFLDKELTKPGVLASELYRAADLSYALAPHRATAYMVGIALGYALHVIQKPLKMPKVMVIVGWISSVALAGWAIFGLRGAATKDFKFDARQVATFNAFAPLAWAVAISWVIMACHVDLGGIVGRILCSRFLLLLSRISYAFYLTQFIVFFHNAGSARSQAEFSICGVLDLWEFVTVLVVSTIFTLLIDLPVQAVRAALTHKTEPKEKNNAGTETRVRRSKQWDRNNELTWRNQEE